MSESASISTPEDSVGEYQISAVAKLTGLTVHNIRAWEKRHGAVEPLRSDNQRRVYSAQDVRKLTLLKALVDAGHSISSVAGLDLDQLEQRLDQAAQARMVTTTSSPPTNSYRASSPKYRTALIGASLQALVEANPQHLGDLEVCSTWPDVETALEDEKPAATLEVLVAETKTIFPDELSRIRQIADRSRACRVVIVYGFCQQEMLRQLDDNSRFTLLRGPVNGQELGLALQKHDLPPGQVVEDFPVPESPAEIPEPLFSSQQLARLARIVPSIRCECPQHLANLISSLSAFEAYSAKCENLNEEDAALHAYLHVTTAKARHEMELALQRVLEAEGIRI